MSVGAHPGSDLPRAQGQADFRHCREDIGVGAETFGASDHTDVILDARVACAASPKVSDDQHVAVGRVGAVMLALEIAIEPADLLPLDDREDRIQGVEVRDLDVGGIDVLGAAPTKEMR